MPETPVLQSRRSNISLSCPEFGYTFIGEDLKHIHMVKSWENCGLLGNTCYSYRTVSKELYSLGKLCVSFPDCTHWTWTIPPDDDEDDADWNHYDDGKIREGNGCFLKKGHRSIKKEAFSITGVRGCTHID